MYKAISGYMYDNGERHSKKHGNWICLNIPSVNKFLLMDSWNGYISLHSGDFVHNHWIGCERENQKRLCFIGGWINNGYVEGEINKPLFEIICVNMLVSK